MRYIPKGNVKNVCPAWYTYVNGPRPRFRGNARALWILRQALAKEQGYLCAFCMAPLVCNINDKGLAKPHDNEMTKIAHLISQHPVQPPKIPRNPSAPVFTQIQRNRLAVKYKNVVLACKGMSPSNRYKHCDLHQLSDDVTIPLFHRGKMRQIRFLANGVIEIDDPTIQVQIGKPTSADDSTSVLNLNNPHLCAERERVWNDVVSEVATTTLSPAQLLKQWQAEARQAPPSRLREYYEIGIYYLELGLRHR